MSFPVFGKTLLLSKMTKEIIDECDLIKRAKDFEKAREKDSKKKRWAALGSSVDSSTPTTLWCRVRIPSTPSTPTSIVKMWYVIVCWEKNKKTKEAGIGPFKKEELRMKESRHERERAGTEKHKHEQSTTSFAEKNIFCTISTSVECVSAQRNR